MTQSPKSTVCRKKRPKISSAGRDNTQRSGSFSCGLEIPMQSHCSVLLFIFFPCIFFLSIPSPLSPPLLWDFVFLPLLSPYHSFLILVVARVRGSRLFTLWWRT